MDTICNMKISVASSLNNNRPADERVAELANLWQQTSQNATFKGSGKDFWDYWAQSMPVKRGSSRYVENVVRRMELLETDSVLDVGAGMGAMTLPVSEKVETVTALDQSPHMLEKVLEKAALKGINNVIALNINWMDAQINKDVPIHDVVLVSRSLPSQGDIVSSLRKIDMAARRTCYITWKANSRNEMEELICQKLGIEYQSSPDYLLLYNLLNAMGIYASVDIFEINGQSLYYNIDDAFIQILKSYQFSNDEDKQTVRDLLAEKLEYSEGFYRLDKNISWALIHWDK